MGAAEESRFKTYDLDGGSVVSGSEVGYFDMKRGKEPALGPGENAEGDDRSHVEYLMFDYLVNIRDKPLRMSASRQGAGECCRQSMQR
jgi:hypothetical protein